jgi:hypothetical protein
MPDQKTDREKEFDEAYKQSWAAFSHWQAEAKNDIRAYLGDSLTAREKNRLLRQDRDALNIQLIRRIINWVSGYQCDHRLGIKYDPNEGGDYKTASQITALVTWALQRFGGYNIISNGFKHALKTGMCLVNAYNDINLDSKLENFFYNQFLLDPNFTRIDLQDCQYGIMRKFITKPYAKMLLPEENHPYINGLDTQRLAQDSKFENYKKPNLYGENLIPYDEFQQRDTKQTKVIMLKPIGREFEFDGTKAELDNMLMNLVTRTGIPPELISVASRTELTVKVTSFLAGKEVIHNVDPFGIGDFSFTPIIGYYDPEYDNMRMKLQGLVRCLVDPQRAENKRVMSMIAWFEQQIGAGLDFEEDTLLDPEDAFKAGPGKPRAFKKDALTQNRVRDRVVPNMPGGMVEIHQILDTMMPKMVNINEEMFGTTKQGASEQIAGVLAKLRVGAGLVGLRGLFDDLSMSQQVIGQKKFKLIQQYPPERVRRIINEQPAPSFYSKKFGKYDALCVEGMLTDTQRSMAYAEMVNMKELGLKLQDPAPIDWSLLLEYAPIQVKEELMERFKAIEQQKNQQMQEQQKTTKLLQQIAIQSAMAEIAADRGKAAERQTQAVENQATSALNRMKTVAQINDLAEKPTERYLKLALELEKMKVPPQKTEAKP